MLGRWRFIFLRHLSIRSGSDLLPLRDVPTLELFREYDERTILGKRREEWERPEFFPRRPKEVSQRGLKE